jgi:hypothetical protein
MTKSAVVHKSIRGRGAPRGNVNARKGISMPQWMNLEDVESILRFMRQVLIPLTLSGKIGTRQSSAITTACRVLLDFDDDILRLREMESGLVRLEQEQRELDVKLRQYRAGTKPVGEVVSDEHQR